MKVPLCPLCAFSILLCPVRGKIAFRDLNIEENSLFLNKKGVCFTLKGHFLLRKKGTFHLEKRVLLGCWKFFWGTCPPCPPPPVPPPLMLPVSNDKVTKELLCYFVFTLHAVSMITNVGNILLRNLLSLALMHEARILLSKQNFSSKPRNKMQAHYYSYCAIL